MTKQDLKNYAIKYQKLGLSILPTKAQKKSAIKWSNLQKDILTLEEINKLWENPISEKFEGLGIITGKVSKNLEVIDIDCKYDQTGTLWNDLSKILKEKLGEDLFFKLTIATTINKGYHIFYFCTKIEGNEKLAKNKQSEAIIETRGEGGYIMVYPSIGYKWIQNDLESIPHITERERELIWDVCRTFDLFKEDPKPLPQPKPIQRGTTSNNQGLSPIDDYKNQAGANEALNILSRHGWKEVGKEGQNIKILRPGDTTSKDSGSFHTGKNTLYLHTTNGHPFETNKPYSPAEIFNLLECKGDWNETAKELRRLGYGGERTQIKNTNNTGLPILPIIIKTTIITETTGNQVTLIINDKTDSKEVLDAIELNSGSQKSIFIQDQEGEIKEGFDYQAQLIFNKYGSIENVKDQDLFIHELISICEGLSPFQNDQYLKKLEDLESLKEMGIQRGTLINAIDQARSTKEKANFKESSLRLSEKFKSDLINMDTDSAIQLHEEGLEKVRGKGKETTFVRLLDVSSEDQLREKESNLPDSLNSGLYLNGEPIEFPSGAISVFCGATGHGKTILLMNSILNTADTYPDKKFIFFSYEERDTIITQYILNIYANIDLNEAKNNRKILKKYFKRGSLDFVSLEKSKEFIKKKSEFFKTYIETGRILIKYIDFDTRELCSGIAYTKRIDPTIGGVFIDYLQLLNIRGNKKQRNEEVKDVCNLLLKTAIATGLPFILSAQFNREVINLSTLHTTRIAEGADIERYSSLIIGIWSLEKTTIFKGATGLERSAIYSKLVEKGLSQLEKYDKKTTITGVNIEKSSPYIYLEILKSRDMGSGGFDFYNYNSNTSKITNRLPLPVETISKNEDISWGTPTIKPSQKRIKK